MPKQSWDADLGMPRLDPKRVLVRMDHLRFQRWLGEHNKLEHPIASGPRGEYAFRYHTSVETKR